MKKLKAWLYGIKADKWLHVICAMAIVQVAYLLPFRAFGKPVGLLLSTAVTLAVCALKELWDMASMKGVASWSDMIAGIIGTVIGFLVMMLI